MSPTCTPFRPYRHLLKAVLASLLLHFVLLLPANRELPLRLESSAPPILLRLGPPQSLAVKPEGTEPTHPLTPAVPVKPQPIPTPMPAKSAAKVATVRPRAENRERPTSPPPPSPPAPRLPPAIPAAPAVASLTDIATPAPIAGSSTGGQSAEPANKKAQNEGRNDGSADGSGSGAISSDALREYRIALASSARRFRRYPALARERGWEGVAEVIVRFGAGASDPAVDIGESSGRAVLDDQAVDMIRQAARASALPVKLKGHDFQIRMPVQFSLDED